MELPNGINMEKMKTVVRFLSGSNTKKLAI